MTEQKPTPEQLAANAALATNPERIQPGEINRVAAAFPAIRTQGKNCFGGFSHSNATLWDFALVAMPHRVWLPSDIAALYHMVHIRGIAPQDAHATPKGRYSVAPDLATAIGNIGLTSYNPQHTTEHTRCSKKQKCHCQADGSLTPHVACINGGWILNPLWRAALGNGVNAGYPGILPLPSATPAPAPKTTGKAKPAPKTTGKAKPAPKTTGKAKPASK